MANDPMARLLDFAVDGIGDRSISGNPAPDILASVEAGGFLDGYAPITKLLPMEGVTLVLLSRDTDTDWFAASSGSGLVFLRAERGEEGTTVAVVEEPPQNAMENLIWMLASKPEPETEPEPEPDIELEVVFDPGE